MRAVSAVLAALLASSEAARLVSSQAPIADIISDEYIAVLQKNATHAHHAALADKHSTSPIRIGAFRAVAGKLSLQSLLADPIVDYVEQNTVVRTGETKRRRCPDTQNSGASWGQSRTTVAKADQVSAQYVHNRKWGEHVDAYILDTGVYCEHNELKGHCEWGLTVTGTAGIDMNGHGTHVAGTVAGKTYGVAKSATIVAVKVLGDSGSGTKEGVIRGVEWSVNTMKTKKRRGVANLSLGGSFSQAQNDAIDAAVGEGLPMAISAGNSNNDACNQSPGSAPKAVTVMSSDLGNNNGVQEDIRSTFSSYGPCADIFAPGSDIVSSYIGNPDNTRVLSGTSMAAPHVAGVMAEYLSIHPNADVDTLRDNILKSALEGLVDLRCSNDICRNSPNRLLHIAC
eukprot:Hpha_TRINITY_DN8895_c0_g1::TRINITY_DN8895_c0_g1_i1::g.141309::m.141309/K01336/E3.4.21.48; cerevisin